MKKLTKEEMKQVKGGLDQPPAGCYCFVPNPMLPADGLDPDCSFGNDPQLYCPGGQLLACC